MTETPQSIEVPMTPSYQAKVSVWPGAFPHVSLIIQQVAQWPNQMEIGVSFDRGAALRLSHALREMAEKIPLSQPLEAPQSIEDVIEPVLPIPFTHPDDEMPF